VETFILSGRIRVNGSIVRSLSLQIDPHRDEIFLDNSKLQILQEPIRILALNKPSGFLTSHSDRFHDQTIFHLLPEEFSQFRFAGRLDLYTRGLLILSNSGETIQKLSHPNFGIEKEYKVFLDTSLDSSFVEREFLLGIRDEGETLRAKSVKPSRGLSSQFYVILEEGRKRQIRRMFRKVHAGVTDLIRTRIGNLRLEDLNLKEGEWCEIDPKLLDI